MANSNLCKGGRKMFILTTDYVGNDKLEGPVRILKGSLLYLAKEEPHQPGVRGPAAVERFWVKVLDTEDLLKVDTRAVREVSERAAGLLEAVTNLDERLALFGNERRLKRLGQIEKGDSVRVQISSSSGEKVPGIVHYKGSIGKSKQDSGIFFGVELCGSAAGKGFTDGTFKGHRFFKCQENCGVFVPVSRIEPVNDSDSTDRDSAGPGGTKENWPLAASLNSGPLALETRVFFMMGDTRQYGTVKFCGVLPNKSDIRILVGILLDNPVGSWNGWYKEMKLCHIPSQVRGFLLPLSKVHTVQPLDPRLSGLSFIARGAGDKNEQNQLIQRRQKEKVPEEENTTEWYIPMEDLDRGNEKARLLSEDPYKPSRPPPFFKPHTEEMAPASSSARDELQANGPASLLDDLQANRKAAGREKSAFGGREAHLEVNYMVEVGRDPLYGMIRWIGEVSGIHEPIAGLELEERLPNVATDGTFRGVRYFHCDPEKGLFVKLGNCRPDSRFASLHSSSNDISALKENASETVEEDTPPEMGKEGGEKMTGWKKGIQGHCNSCYLDATLFCMFAFSSVLDTILLRPQDKNDEDSYSQTRDLLRTEIVNPLRKNGYVCATKVMALRKILEAGGQSTGFLTEEKDPEEFLNKLFQVLKVEPLLKIRSATQKPQDCIFYQIFMEKKQSVNIPSVQQLLEWSFVNSDLKFTEAPSCFIVQMPRFGKNFKMFSTILPTLELDITDLLEDTPRECSICQSLSMVECRNCYEDSDITPGRIKQYCSVCSKQVHQHRNRKSHDPRNLLLPKELQDCNEFPGSIPHQTMELSAVLCIETSHYVAFVKYGPADTDWLFFDSMADRKGGQSGFNIPQVSPCPEVAEYLKMSADELRDLDPKSMQGCVRRLLCDAYMCMYHNPTLSLYK
ncbi:ubiquitin carboxyl-terminal hydrolase CYLD [Latimeria chalumnae]|uniref:ubiquitin carboxyl-terminal hydrolase CYLD n=1 Tax=Latimeria chalumnae TaxID=7897 RepID=UPI0003C1654C|nr:PREDICTED: ubiquitin carboxyl-terminal hydrolase CYLD-like [Latimeria chalumnae]|eukprot:XP_006007582.1 PREDICTED: ubiquitin carboxyl-terminal hydrolase CYLD-like [Latimeria chalumnae]